jgi:hypothetical protein
MRYIESAREVRADRHPNPAFRAVPSRNDFAWLYDDRDVSPNQLPFPAIGSIGAALPWLELNQRTERL